MARDKAIGIASGTTYNCVGVWNFDRVEIMTNDQGNRTTPSIVAFSEIERLFGEGVGLGWTSFILLDVVDPYYLFASRMN